MRKVLPTPTLKQRSISALPSEKKTKKVGKLKSILASLLVLAFATVGLSASFATPAQAGQVTDCPLDIDNNPWVESLGGLTTLQYNTIKNGSALRANPDEATVRDKWSSRIRFVSWMPSIKSGGWLQSDPATTERKIAKSISYGSFYDTKRGQFYIPKWEEYTDAPASGEGVGPKALIRQGETYSVDILGVPLPCAFYTATTDLEDMFPNFMMEMASGINSIATSLYVTANSGVNITQAVGIEDGNITTDPSYESWVYAIGLTIEEFLTGEDGLYDSLYLTMLLPLIFIGGIVIIFNGIRRRATQVLTGIVWMIVVGIAGILFLTRPMLVPQVIDATVGTITTGVNSAILGAGEEEAIGCEPKLDGEGQLSEGKRIAKRTECLIWYNTIYKTWAQGQFGVIYAGPNKNDDAFKTLSSTYGTSAKIGGKNIAYNDLGGWPAYQLDNGHNPLGANVSIYMNGNKDLGRGWFDGGDKWGSSFTAFAVSLTSAVFIAVNAILIIAYQIVTLLLLMVAPLFLLIGIIPSKTGKGIVLRWAELIIGIAVKRLVITILMAVFIKLFLLIMSANLGFFLQAIIFAVLAVIGITQRSKILEMFTANINFGGDKSINVGASIEKLGEKAPVMAKDATKAAGGWAAARGVGAAKYAIASNRTDKFKRSLEGKTDEEKEALIRAEQDKSEKRQMKWDVLKGKDSSLGDNQRRMLDPIKDEVRSDISRNRAERVIGATEDQAELTRRQVVSTGENINRTTRRAVGGAAAAEIGETRRQGQATRNTASAEASDTRDAVSGSRDAIIGNSNNNRGRLESELNAGLANTNSIINSDGNRTREVVGRDGEKTRNTVGAEAADTRRNSDVNATNITNEIKRDGSVTRNEVSSSKQEIINNNNSSTGNPRVEKPAPEKNDSKEGTRASVEASKKRLEELRGKALPPKPESPPKKGDNN